MDRSASASFLCPYVANFGAPLSIDKAINVFVLKSSYQISLNFYYSSIGRQLYIKTINNTN